MKLKRFAAFTASLASAAIMAAALPLNALAAGTDYSTDRVNEADMESVDFTKYLVMDVNANVPNAEFTYSIAGIDEEDAIAATETTLAVLPGVGSPKFKAGDETSDTGTAAFTPEDTTKLESEKGDDTVEFVTPDTTDEKYAQKTITLDFSEVVFTEPGVYRYILTETNDAPQGVTNDPVIERTLDVYVQDASTDEAKLLEIAAYVMYKDTIDTAPKIDKTTEDPNEVPNGAEASSDKIFSYTNKYTTYDLHFGKEVEGNQGSKDKYFAFTVSLSGAVAGTKYTVDLSEADAAAGSNSATKAEYRGKANPNEIVADENGEATATFYLQDGQYIVIQGLAENTGYSVEEEAEDYASSSGTDREAIAEIPAQGTEGDESYVDAVPAKPYNDSPTGTMTSDIYTGYTNTREGVIPTGILLSIAAPAVIGVIVLSGIVILLIRGRKRKAEEE